MPLIKKAIEREKKMIENSIKITKEKIEALSRSLGVDINKLLSGEVEHEESKDMQLIELEGELEILKHLESELEALETVEVCK